jgi:hypothetical protein
VEEEVFSAISPGDFYQSAEDLNSALTGVYAKFQEHYGGLARLTYYLPIESATENGAPNRSEDGAHLYNVWALANDPSRTINRWQSSYEIINSANVVIGRGADIEMDENLKKQIFAEARFLRGLSYFYLVRLYGGVPIPESFTQSKEGLEIPRKSVEEVYDYIIADFEYASENLPLKSEFPANEVWRASKGAAQALLSKVYLTRGSMTGDQLYFQESKKYAQMVIESGVYEIEPDFRDLWKWYNPENENGQESIFEIQHAHLSGENNNMHIHFGVSIEMTDPSIGNYMWHRYGPSFYAYNSYSEQDYRKSSTFLTDVTLSTGRTYRWVQEDKGFYPGSEDWQSATPGNIKYYDRSVLALPAANIYIMRYAEVLLDYAEAENALNGPTTDAYEKINIIRDRAHLDDLTQGLTQEQFADAIYRERSWEFIGEGKLYYDGIRTGKITEAVKAEVAYGNEKGLFLYTPLQFAPTKNFLWKIPAYDLSANPALVQNPDNENGL